EARLQEVTVLAAALSIQDPRERPLEKADAADQAHAQFKDPASDFITLLNIWKRYIEARRELKSFNKVKKFCKARFLSFMRMREWRDIHDQIKAILGEHGFVDKGGGGGEKTDDVDDKSRFSAGYAGIHKSILSGFLSNIAMKKEKNIFKAARGHEVMIFPGSGLFKRPGSWIVAAEMVETSRAFARTAANIDVAWLEKLGGDMCRRVYLNPRWERNRGETAAMEQVSLFGLIIVSDRKISYGRIDPGEATDIFIQGALVDGDVKKPFAFMKHNRECIDEVQTMESKVRRRDILVSEEDLADFYSRRLPTCYNLKTLARRIKQKGGDDFLRMGEKDLLRYTPDREELSLFPDQVDLGGNRFECGYTFDPGADKDGITVKIPSALAPMAPAERVDWLVPGLLKEKIFGMIKGLPKKYRKRLVPVADSVEVIMAEMPRTDDALVTALGSFIHRRFGVDIPGVAWSEEALPDHLRMRISITDPSGREIRASRNKAILQRETREKAGGSDFEREKKRWERTGLTRWDMGDLPEVVRIGGEGAPTWALHPGLARSDGPGVALRLFRDRGRALASHKDGVAALYEIHFAKDLKFLKKRLLLPPGMKGPGKVFGGIRTIQQRLYDRVVRDLFSRD
ncbi:MAG: DUF3418 domain-containing protein, partial [Desulfobacterales bacterium]|nr:DUF3418 domain-containing protein [Desulfobacterales bacterium]